MFAVGLVLGHAVLSYAVGSALRPLAPIEGDVPYYFSVASIALAKGSWSTYPAGAMVAFVAPFLFGAGFVHDQAGYERVFVLLNAGYSGLIALLIFSIFRRAKAGSARAWRAVGTYTLLILIGAPTYLWRFDLFPALLTTLGFWLITLHRYRLSLLPLVFAALTKLYSGLVVALVLVVIVRRRIGLLSSAVIAIFAVVFALALVLMTKGTLILPFLETSLARPLEIQSTAGGLFLLASWFGLPVEILTERSSWNVHAIGAETVASLTPVFLALSFAIVFYRATVVLRRTRSSTEGLEVETPAALCAALIAAFLVTNKVFSPQYLVWLCPFVPFLERRQVWTFFAVAVLTAVAYPCLSRYGDLPRAELAAVMTINLRNALMVYLAIDLTLSAGTLRQRASLREEKSVLLLPVLAGVWAIVCLFVLPRPDRWIGKQFSTADLSGSARDVRYRQLHLDQTGRGDFSASFDSCLQTRERRTLDLYLRSDGRRRLFLDETLVIDTWESDSSSSEKRVEVLPGPHHVRIEYARRADRDRGNGLLQFEVFAAGILNAVEMSAPQSAPQKNSRALCQPIPWWRTIVGARLQSVDLGESAVQTGGDSVDWHPDST